MTASSTFMTFLMHKADGEAGTWTNLCPIKSYPAPRPARETIETTTLSDRAHTYIQGLINQDGNLEFKVNLDADIIKTITALENKEGEYAIWMGGTDDGKTVTPTGDICKIGGKGIPFLSIDEGDVNAVREATIDITPTTPWDFIAEA